MDYFLQIYGINDWNDYIVKSIETDINDNIQLILLSILFKTQYHSIIKTSILLNTIRRIFSDKGLCNKNITIEELNKLIDEYIDKYANNPKEALLIDKLKKD